MDTCLPAGRERRDLKKISMAFVIYAIKSSLQDRIYVGFTADIDKRIMEHNSGRTKSTKGFRPWKLFYTETVETREKAREREKFLKSGCGKEFLKKILPVL